MSEIEEVLSAKGYVLDSHKDVLVSRDHLVEIIDQLIFKNK